MELETLFKKSIMNVMIQEYKRKLSISVFIM